jgi:hypothetical protein
MFRTVAVLALLGAWSASAAEKPIIVYKAPPAGEDDRPVITEIVFAPQGTDYAFKIEFNKDPWGEGCKTRCANATIFLDTDNDKKTGLKLGDPKAVETGADLAITLQGARVLKDTQTLSTLRVKVIQYSEESTTVESGSTLAELDAKADSERVLAEGTSVYLLVDASVGDIPSGAKARLVYHPPESKPLVGVGKGLSVAGSSHVELFKDGKLTNPPKKKKTDYEKY